VGCLEVLANDAIQVSQVVVLDIMRSGEANVGRESVGWKDDEIAVDGV